MSSLFFCVLIYWFISVFFGLMAGRRVHSAGDFAVAGHHLPLPIVIATVFATWFGAETVLGIPAVFLKEGLHGVVADPFGSSLCLILVGLFFARPLYRLRLLTIGDFYRKRYNRFVETATTGAIIISYIGWVGAQLTALGLVINLLSQGVVSQETGIVIGAVIIMCYTFWGGMWAVAIMDLLQMSVIMVSLLWIVANVGGQLNGISTVVLKAQETGHLQFLPPANLQAIITFIGALITMMLGSIPQQDIFQRVQSAKNATTAMWGSIIGGSLYFLFAFIPMFLAYCATLIMPDTTKQLILSDPQLILPRLILEHTSLLTQILFFGALVSAINSCASATILAPSVTFTENILRSFFEHKKKLSDIKLLWLMRCITALFTVITTVYALYSIKQALGIFKMVENAYQITLVMAFVPLSFGLYWKRANNQGALTAMFLGVGTWLSMLLLGYGDYFISPHLAGLFMALIGMIVGSLLPQKTSLRTSHNLL